MSNSRRTEPAPKFSPAARLPATFRSLPLTRGQQAAVERFLAEAQQRGQAPDSVELSRMLHDMLSPPLAENDDGGVPAGLRMSAERAAGLCQDSADAFSSEEERHAAAEAEAMKRG